MGQRVRCAVDQTLLCGESFHPPRCTIGLCQLNALSRLGLGQGRSIVGRVAIRVSCDASEGVGFLHTDALAQQFTGADRAKRVCVGSRRLTFGVMVLTKLNSPNV